MKITVVVPVYNCEHYIEVLLKQLLAQSYMDFEVIMVNDGSTDGSGDICKRYRDKDNRFRYYEFENEGVSNARNHGIDLAKGEYIIFFDADDKLENDALYILNLLAQNTNADMIVFGYYMELLKGDTVKYKSTFAVDENLMIYSDDSFSMLSLWKKSLMYNVWNRMIKTDIIKNNSLMFDVNLSMGEDLDFILDVLKCCCTVYMSKEVLYHYVRERQGSATSNSYIKNWFEIRTEEKKRLDVKFRQLGYYNKQYINFLDKRYIERVIGCIENEFKCKNMSMREKYFRIKKIVSSKAVRESLNSDDIIFNSKLMKIIFFSMKKQRYVFIYLIGFFSYLVRKYFSQLFMYLKNNR